MNNKPLADTQRIRVIIDGVQLYCQVRDLASDILLACLADINAHHAAGRPCLGLMSGYGGHTIQIDIESPRRPIRIR